MHQGFRSARALDVLRIGLYAIALLTIGFGIATAISGLTQASRDDRASAEFRSDRGCAVDLAAGDTASGACATVPVRFVYVSAGALGRSTGPPFVDIALTGRSPSRAPLVWSAGRRFAEAVRPGTPGRALLFHGAVVRVAANGIAADTQSAPVGMARRDLVLPWVGSAVAVFGLVFLLGTHRLMRLIE